MTAIQTLEAITNASYTVIDVSICGMNSSNIVNQFYFTVVQFGKLEIHKQLDIFNNYFKILYLMFKNNLSKYCVEVLFLDLVRVNFLEKWNETKF